MILISLYSLLVLVVLLVNGVLYSETVYLLYTGETG